MNYKKDLKNVPQEIIDKMVERQVEQCNDADATVFDLIFSADRSEGGFNWDKTIEGFEFWESIEQGNYKRFYDLYPKTKV